MAVARRPNPRQVLPPTTNGRFVHLNILQTGDYFITTTIITTIGPNCLRAQTAAFRVVPTWALLDFLVKSLQIAPIRFSMRE